MFPSFHSVIKQYSGGGGGAGWGLQHTEQRVRTGLKLDPDTERHFGLKFEQTGAQSRSFCMARGQSCT